MAAHAVANQSGSVVTAVGVQSLLSAVMVSPGPSGLWPCRVVVYGVIGPDGAAEVGPEPAGEPVGVEPRTEPR